MKTLFASLATVASVTFAHAGWSFITMLKTEPEPRCQRVAFIGCGVIKQVEGKVERLCGIDCWSPVKTGTELKCGDVIRTGDGTVVLKMEETHSFIKVTPNTVFRLLPSPEPDSTATSLAVVTR